jgi:hypothetical protein
VQSVLQKKKNETTSLPMAALTVWEVVYWIHSVEDRSQLRAFVHAVMIPFGLYKTRVISWLAEEISASDGRFLIHGVSQLVAMLSYSSGIIWWVSQWNIALVFSFRQFSQGPKIHTTDTHNLCFPHYAVQWYLG